MLKVYAQPRSAPAVAARGGILGGIRRVAGAVRDRVARIGGRGRA